nr:MAG TPA: hypothetical protein [Caudoviricetes sp.]
MRGKKCPIGTRGEFTRRVKPLAAGTDKPEFSTGHHKQITPNIQGSLRRAFFVLGHRKSITDEPSHPMPRWPFLTTSQHFHYRRCEKCYA